MIVMTAGVHHAHFLPIVLRAHTRLERKLHLFGDGQPVHVGAQRDDLAWTGAAQHAHDARAADAFADHEAERAQMLRDERGGAHFLP